MQISSGKDGIQRLLAAEKEAQNIVSQARKARTDRLKQAKAEAEKEIKAYRQQREEKYQKAISEDSDTSSNNAKRLEGETKSAKQSIDQSISSKKQDVIDTLVKYVSQVASLEESANLTL